MVCAQMWGVHMGDDKLDYANFREPARERAHGMRLRCACESQDIRRDLRSVSSPPFLFR